jgi:hypothetical protein
VLGPTLPAAPALSTGPALPALQTRPQTLTTGA